MFDRILVTTDGSDLSNEALRVALDMARPMGSLLVVLHVIPSLELNHQLPVSKAVHHEQQRDSEGILKEALSELDYARVQALTLEAHNERIADVIARAATEQNADLIVMGTHGRQGFDKVLLGSVAERVLHTAKPPVMLVRAGQRAHVQSKHAQTKASI